MVYNKLIRDKIPEIILKNGKTPKYRVIEGEEFASAGELLGYK